MYCNNCKDFFDEPIVYVEESTGYREENCPYCGGDDLEETNLCRCCGAETVNEFCDNCMEAIAEELLDFQRRFEVTADVVEDMIVAYYGF